MPKHEFKPLYDQYRAVIAQMPAVFSSHQFISRLAQQNQALYIEALHSYRDSRHRGRITPFRVVHQILSTYLNQCPQVRRVGKVMSTDIFGQPNTCAQWRKR